MINTTANKLVQDVKNLFDTKYYISDLTIAVVSDAQDGTGVMIRIEDPQDRSAVTFWMCCDYDNHFKWLYPDIDSKYIVRFSGWLNRKKTIAERTIGLRERNDASNAEYAVKTALHYFLRRYEIQ